MKEKLVEFLKLDRRKIILALLIPYLWNLFAYGLVFLISLIGETVLLPPFFPWLGTFLSKVPIFLLESVFYYFFACSLVVVYDYWKLGELRGLKKEKGLYRLVIIGLLVFNPITLNILSRVFLVTMFFTQYGKVAPQMGLTILEVYPNSTAEMMRLEEGQVISKIGYIRREWIGNTKTIVKDITKENPSISDAKEILNYIDPNDPIDEVHIEIYLGGGYLKHPSSKTLGIKVRDRNGTEAVL